MVRLAPLLVVAALAAPGAAGPCAIRPLVPMVMTPSNTTIRPLGGVVVGLAQFGFDQVGEGLVQSRWKFHEGSRYVAPTIRTIAPGLAVYEPPPGTGTMKLVEVRKDGQRVLVAVRRTIDKPSPLPKLVLRAARHRHDRALGPRGYDRTTVEIDLAAPPPVGAIAVLLYAGGKTPRVASWVETTPGRSLTIYHSPGRCETQIPGFVDTAPGTRVSVAWLDASGWLSPRSNEVVVTRVAP